MEEINFNDLVRAMQYLETGKSGPLGPLTSLNWEVALASKLQPVEQPHLVLPGLWARQRFFMDIRSSHELAALVSGDLDPTPMAAVLAYDPSATIVQSLVAAARCAPRHRKDAGLKRLDDAESWGLLIQLVDRPKYAVIEALVEADAPEHARMAALALNCFCRHNDLFQADEPAKLAYKPKGDRMVWQALVEPEAHFWCGDRPPGDRKKPTAAQQKLKLAIQLSMLPLVASTLGRFPRAVREIDLGIMAMAESSPQVG